jgi:dihydroxyacetone kinase-like protein
MSDKLSYMMARNFLLTLTDLIIRSKDELNRMDAECGDGDFGTTMFVAFTNVQRTIQIAKSEDIGGLFMETGQAVLSSAGGVAGPIFATLFSEAGKTAKGKKELTVTELTAMFENALLKIEQRGHARIDDKTLVDALDPAVRSLQESSTHNTPLNQALEDTVRAARMGYERTKGLVARQGKARYLAEQTVGHLDGGAYVVVLLFQCLRDQALPRSQDIGSN